jgi:hypothetical protein
LRENSPPFLPPFLIIILHITYIILNKYEHSNLLGETVSMKKKKILP